MRRAIDGCCFMWSTHTPGDRIELDANTSRPSTSPVSVIPAKAGTQAHAHQIPCRPPGFPLSAGMTRKESGRRPVGII